MRRIRKTMTSAGMIGALALVGCASTQSSAEDNYPRQRIEIIVPWGAGGGTDQVTRQLAFAAENICDWNVSVTNTEGGGGTTGASTIVNAKPDGYTLGSLDSSILYYAPSNTADIEPADFEPLMEFNDRPTTVGIAKDLPYDSLEGLIAAAEEGEQIRVAVNSLSGAHHVSAWGLAQEAGVEFTYVPYPQGAASATQGILAGEAEVIIADDAEMLPFVEDDEILPIAMLTDERGELFPEVPTAKELGYDWSNPLWRGIFVPLETPQAVQDSIEDCFLKAAESEEFLKFMDTNGFKPSAQESDAFKERIEEDYEVVKSVLTEMGS